MSNRNLYSPGEIKSNRWSSAYMAGVASVILRYGSNRIEKSLAPSVIAQAAAKQRRTSVKLASLASRVLNNSNSSRIAKKLAGSVLSQREL